MIDEVIARPASPAPETVAEPVLPHAFERGYDWSRSGAAPRVKSVSPCYSTLIAPRHSEV